MRTFRSKSSFSPANNQKTSKSNSTSTFQVSLIAEQKINPNTPPVQMLSVSGPAASNPTRIHHAAMAGVQGSGSKLPYFDRIQSAFEQHDMSHVQAYIGPHAAKANAAMGARAYAIGDKIAFAQANPSLHTVAHEAAHVLQQRGGVQLKGGIGKAGDKYEQEADKIAKQVVQGNAVQLPPTANVAPSSTNIQFDGDESESESEDEMEIADEMLIEEDEPQYYFKKRKRTSKATNLSISKRFRASSGDESDEEILADVAQLSERKRRRRRWLLRTREKRQQKVVNSSHEQAFSNIQSEVSTPPAICFPVIDLHQQPADETDEEALSRSVVEGIKQLMQGKKFNLGNGDEHRLYLGSYESDGPLELMIQSYPKPFKDYIIFLNSYNGSTDEVNKAKERLKTKYTELKKDLEKYAHPNNNYNNDSIAVFQKFLDSAVQIIEGDLRESVASFQQRLPLMQEYKRSNNSFNTTFPVPPTAQLDNCYTLKNFGIISGVNYQLTAGINVPILSVRGPAGSVANGPPDNSGFTLREKIGQKDQGKEGQLQRYTEGHLLNNWLHGPGTDWRNLALIPYTVNIATADNCYWKAPEEWAKNRVLGLNQVISYKVDVEYNRENFDGFYEKLLPSRLIYTLHRQVLHQGRWKNSGNSKDKFSKSYECNLVQRVPDDLTPIEMGPNDPLGNYFRQQSNKKLIEEALDEVGNSEQNHYGINFLIYQRLKNFYNNPRDSPLRDFTTDIRKVSSDKEAIRSLGVQTERLSTYIKAAENIHIKKELASMRELLAQDTDPSINRTDFIEARSADQVLDTNSNIGPDSSTTQPVADNSEARSADQVLSAPIDLSVPFPPPTSIAQDTDDWSNLDFVLIDQLMREAKDNVRKENQDQDLRDK